jgi:hypothetical protein
MEGAKGIESAVTRHVARHLRHAPPQPRPPGKQGGQAAGARPAAALVLSVAQGGRELQAAVVPRPEGQQQRQQQGGRGLSAEQRPPS